MHISQQNAFFFREILLDSKRHLKHNDDLTLTSKAKYKSIFKYR